MVSPQPPIERTGPMRCPSCGSDVDSRAQVGTVGAEKVDGDVSICFYCSGLGIYVGTPAVGIRPPTPEEERALRADPEIKKLLGDLMLFRAVEGLS